MKLGLALAVAILSGVAVSATAWAKPENGRTFGTWTVQCAVPPGKSEAQCVASQTQIVNETKARLLTMEVDASKPDVSVLALLPLGVSLPAGVALVWEDGSKTPMTFQRCVPDGCIATLSLNAGQVKALRQGKKLLIRATLPGMANTSDIAVSLDGIDAAIESLK